MNTYKVIHKSKPMRKSYVEIIEAQCVTFDEHMIYFHGPPTGAPFRAVRNSEIAEWERINTNKKKNNQRSQAIRIKITTKKILVRGEPYREILAISMAKYTELPTKYINNGPYVYLHEDGQIRLNLLAGSMPPNSLRIDYKTGGKIKAETYENLINHFRTCGDRLSEINREIRETLAVEWNGREETEII